MSTYPYDFPKRERTPEEQEAWIAEFRRRNGLDKPIPLPPPDAPSPPKPHSEAPEREPSEEG